MIQDPLGRRRFIANACLSSALLLCALLLLYPPLRTNFYPACPIRQYLGVDCPGCGATRALAALLHGHLTEAFRLNALFVVLFPVALAVGIETYRRAIRPERFRFPNPPMAAIYAVFAVTTIYTVARNLQH